MATQAQKANQLYDVQKLLLTGYTRSYILEFMEDKYSIKRATTDNLITEATKRIQEINAASMLHNLAVLTNNQWDLYRKAVADGNLSLARQLLMDMAKLRGLDVNSINLVVEDKRELEEMSDEDLDKLLNGN